MRLKGSMLDKLSPHKREKMENTLKRMGEVRRNDDMRLRDIIESKKGWAINERKTGFDVIDNLDSQIEGLQTVLDEKIEELKLAMGKEVEEIKERQEKVRVQVIRLDGVLLVLNDLISESAKQDEELKKQHEVEAVRKDKEEAAIIAAEKKAREKALMVEDYRENHT